MQSGDQLAGPILPPHIEETVHAIAALTAQHQRRASPVQRIVARSVQLIGQPQFVGLLTVALVCWIAANAFLGRRAFDPYPYTILFDIGEALGIYITVLILITQRHDDELRGLREQLTLELAILSEQKSAKIIQLLEELRRDHPDIADRRDREAEALSVAADPQAVLEAIIVQEEQLAAVETAAPPA